jgi:hypothetical protein
MDRRAALIVVFALRAVIAVEPHDPSTADKQGRASKRDGRTAVRDHDRRVVACRMFELEQPGGVSQLGRSRRKRELRRRGPGVLLWIGDLFV